MQHRYDRKAAVCCYAAGITLFLFTAVPTPARGEPVDYLGSVKPILETKCFACHSALKQEAGLRLDAASLILQGGDSGVVLEPGDADASSLLERVTDTDSDQRMPPEGDGTPLNSEQVETIRTWINEGAIAPEEPIPSHPGEHWAYQKTVRPPVPAVQNPGWVSNALDQFIAASHDQVGLTPVPEATPEVLLRRVYLNLIGLPPTHEQLIAFLNDKSPGAYEREVDRLLDNPQYGERWGRHWMDVWRYSDWSGFNQEVRYSQRHIWRWRDWIIESFNNDKGYDRMILEMLAADELCPDDENAIRATGFLVRNWYKFDRNVWLDDVIEHTGRALLGVTMKCAKCHDHKYDPISQAEYYRLRAVFEPCDVRTDRVLGELETSKDGLPRIYDAQLETPTYLFERGNPKQPDTSTKIDPGSPSVFGGTLDIQPVVLPVDSYYPSLRTFVSREMIIAAKDAVHAAEVEVQVQEEKFSDRTPLPRSLEYKLQREALELAHIQLDLASAKLASLEVRLDVEQMRHPTAGSETSVDATALQELTEAAGQAHRRAQEGEIAEQLLMTIQQLGALRLDVFRKKNKYDTDDSKFELRAAEKRLDKIKQLLEGKWETPKEGVASYGPLGKVYPRVSTGRRLALARWITDRGNPLTARVAINHIWLRHFGRPLVEKIDDFGLRSPRPPLADLLDYLAAELMDNQWSMKHIHRMIVTSSVYRMRSAALEVPDSSSSEIAGDPQSTDPDNKNFWRMNVRRAEAETVRDTLLYLAGNLDLAQGGPQIDHHKGFVIPRRSIYFHHARDSQMPFLNVFDAANPRECYRRQETVRPQQALALVNSSLALAQSRQVAFRLSEQVRLAGGHENRGGSSHDHFITLALETILSREPSAAELTVCREFLEFQAKQLSVPERLTLLNEQANDVAAATDPVQRARENLVLVLINHNDFVTIR
ncbi:MAG: hypothetical protein CMJ62_10515 [Planctomycetaceae bacterium]|nr:hypothetical protein [Planctomycetaceae bacterium]